MFQPHTAIDAGAFKGCTGLKQIRLPMDCTINDTAFDDTAMYGRSALLVIFAEEGGTTQQWAKDHHVCFVEYDR